jgi:multidrug efflux system membrane fusion protein
LWLFGLAVVALALWFEFHPGMQPPANQHAQLPAAAITAARAGAGNMPVYISAIGTVTPVYTVMVYSQVTGRIVAVHYRQGQMVKQGDTLVDIDPRPYQAQLTQAEGTLAHDRAALASARIDLARYRAAGAAGAVAQQTVEDQLHLVEQLEGSVKADEGTVAYNQTQLSYTHILSPIDGRVGLRLVDPGNVVFAGNSSILVVITQLQPITVIFPVSEDDLPAIQAQLRGGHALPVDAFDRTNSHLIASGTLASLNNQVDTTTGTVKFRADFANANLALFPNQFVNARLLLRTLRNVTLVPTAAVQYNGTESFVYIVTADHTVKVQPVTVLNGDDRQTAVSGVDPGTTVATSGFDRLENGARVTVRNEAPAQKRTPQAGSPSIGKTPPGQPKQ